MPAGRYASARSAPDTRNGNTATRLGSSSSDAQSHHTALARATTMSIATRPGIRGVRCSGALGCNAVLRPTVDLCGSSRPSRRIYVETCPVPRRSSYSPRSL
jgi:hypothetical protein